MNQFNHSSMNGGVHNNTMNMQSNQSGNFSFKTLFDKNNSRMGPGKLNIPQSIN